MIRWFLLSCMLASMGCTHRTTAQYNVEQAFPALSFDRPVDLQDARDGTNRLFVVEQAGIIRVFNNDAAAAGADVFLDIRSLVNSSGNEEGLLGLAFHPDFRNNGFFYVNYTANPPRRTVIARFKVSPDNPNKADPQSETILLTFSQPYSNHNGGQVSFGPDGFLYIAAGDGGSGGDPQGNGQNKHALLGKILRIDVDRQEGGKQYAIPSDNPFKGLTDGSREEIFAYGLRNPWRFSFDAATGELWAGDVGQDSWEEIDIIRNGKNYGWNIMEGTHCYPPGNNGCDTTGIVKPVVEYSHSLGISVTGGFVYRGSATPSLQGWYVYADFGSGRIWALRIDTDDVIVNNEISNSALNISSFGVDRNNNLFLCTFSGGGKIYKITETSTGIQNRPGKSSGYRLDIGYPNPLSRAGSMLATIPFAIPQREDVQFAIEDILGRQLRVFSQGILNAGEHTATLLLTGITPGSYYCALLSGGVRITQAIVIVR
jgi:glucose/arabinose dehydrogenase